MPFLIVTNGMSNLARADGSPKYSMTSMLIGAIVNTILDPVFIFVFHWGVAGAAWATVIGQICSFVSAVIYIGKFKNIELKREDIRLVPQECLKTASLGMSNSLNQATAQALDGLSAADEKELFAFAEYHPEDAEKTGFSGYSYWRSTLRVFTRNKMAMFLLGVIIVLLLFTFIQPYLPGQRDPIVINNDENGIQIINMKPNSEFWFGTNSIGQDLWSRVWSGTRTSLFIGFSVAMWEVAFGILIGVLWGYVRKLDFFFTELYNVVDNIPQTIVLILFSYIMRPSVGTLIFAMCLTGWLTMARFVRNQIVIIRDRDYNLASRCLGSCRRGASLCATSLPYLVSVIMMRVAMAIPLAIGNEVFITYIGLGLPVSTPSLGKPASTRAA